MKAVSEFQIGAYDLSRLLGHGRFHLRSSPSHVSLEASDEDEEESATLCAPWIRGFVSAIKVDSKE